jgi:hypothetical protein
MASNAKVVTHGAGLSIKTATTATDTVKAIWHASVGRLGLFTQFEFSALHCGSPSTGRGTGFDTFNLANSCSELIVAVDVAKSTRGETCTCVCFRDRYARNRWWCRWAWNTTIGNVDVDVVLERVHRIARNIPIPNSIPVTIPTLVEDSIGTLPPETK